MAFLLAIVLLAAFSAALLHPYGRRLLATMAIVAAILVLLLVGAVYVYIYSVDPRPSH